MPRKRPLAQVREPLQVYITSDERRLLDRMAKDTGISRAEVLRRGLRSFAREQPAEQSRMLAFVREMRGGDWPADIARNHDKYLDEAHLDTHAKRRPSKKAKKKR